MFIKQLHLNNFKNFTNNTFNFKSQFSAAIGDNGMGKSSLLHGLQATLGAYLQCLPIPSSNVYRRQIKSSEIYTYWDSDKLDYVSSKEETMVSAIVNFNEEEIDWRRIVLNKRTTSHNKRDTGRLISAVEKILKDREEKKNAILPVIASFSTKRAATQQRKGIKAQTRRGRLEKGYLAALLDSSDFEGIIEWLHNYDSNIKQQKEFEGTREAVFTAIERAIPFLSEIAYNSYYTELEANVNINGNQSGKITHSNMSDGVKAMLNMVSEIAFRCVTLNGFLGENAVLESNGIVLIDELDMHLHPLWQRHVVDDLKKAFPKIQFVVTTHSPFIVQTLEQDELINLDKTILENPKNMTLNKVITEIMGVEKLKSDDFENRFNVAFNIFNDLEKDVSELSLDDYKKVLEIINGVVQNETEDPVYKAYLKVKETLK